MYINFMSEENRNIYVYYWLLLITFLVGLIIMVGGLTRLTDSGLSITKWDLFSGVLPPLSLADWEKFFSLYKQIPEYREINSSMTLDQFKIIYWWEYAHRLLGRIIGIFYILPLLFFTFKKKINKKDATTFYLIFFLICLQGFLGWYMVKSGLTERVDVSHYRLSVHLTLAFVILIFLLWSLFKYKYHKSFFSDYKLPKYIPVIFLFCILIQISIGALVSGLDAGQIYQSWPLMNSSYFPDDSNLKILFSINSLENPSIVQFIHRNIAYFIFLFFLVIFFMIFKNNELRYLRNTSLLIFALLLLQIFLGILTILSGAQIILASMHQLGSIFLIAAALMLVFKNSKFS